MLATEPSPAPFQKHSLDGCPVDVPRRTAIVGAYRYIMQRRLVVEVLRQFIKNVLEVSDKRRLRTVAIPAVGTGGLDFPADVVASCLFNECDKFSASHSPTTLSEVRIVIYEKDQTTFDVRRTVHLSLQCCPWVQAQPNPTNN